MSLAIADLSFSYQRKSVFRGLCLDIAPGEVVSLVGPNGSGKTTLLKCIGKLLSPRSGRVAIGETDLHGLSAKELAKHVGYVPQDTGANFPITTLNAVLLGRTPHVRYGAGEEDMDIAIDALARMGLSDFSFHMINELSGGERQRVFIARALAQQPQVLLLDEPTSNLDLRHQLETLRIVREVAERSALMVIMAIHDLNLAGRFSDRVVMLKNGSVLASGGPSEVISPENIRETYGVEAMVRVEAGLPFVMPMNVI